MNQIRAIVMMLILCGGSAFSQIVVPQSRFDANAGYWYVKSDAPWNFLYPARNAETNSLVWITSETNNITTAPLVTVTVKQPVGGGYQPNNPTYTNLPGKAVARLTPGGGHLEFQFPNLPPGVRHIRVYGFATNDIVECVAHSGWVGGVPPDRRSVRRPLELQWEINDGPAGETNCYRMLGFYCSSNALWEIQRFYVVGRAATNQLWGRLSVSTNSLVTLDVAQLEFVEEIDFSRTNLWKTTPTMYTEAERTERIATAGSLTNEPFASWNKNTPSFSAPTAQSTWDAMYSCWPGYHVNYGEGMGTVFSAGTVWKLTPRSSGNIQYGDWRYALKFTNGSTVVTANNWNRGTVPAYGGMEWDAATTNWKAGIAMDFCQGQALDYRVMGLIGNDNAPQYNPFQRWHYYPSHTNAVHHGACALANYMAIYPSINYERSVAEILDNESPNYGYKFSSQTSRRKGRHVYDGWQGQRAEQIVKSIDDGWDYFTTSTAFAGDLTREWPFIANSTNQVKIFFNRILDLMVKDYDMTIARGNAWTLGLVLQSGTNSLRLMDASQTPVSIVPTGDGGGAKYQYASSLSQQGTHYIGSLYYLIGGIMSDAYDTFNYYKLGGSTAPYDLSDLSAYRKIGAWADLYATLSVANGYMPDFGDAGKRNWEKPALHDVDFQRAWQMLEATGSTNRFRMARYLRDVAGRGDLSTAEWAAVSNEATQAAFDIRRATESRVHPGIGLAVLETGLGSTNDLERAAVILKTGVGYGHDHSDHLDFNYYALKARLLPDFATRYEGSMLMYPYSYVQDVHNVVSVGGWDDARTLDTEGCNSGNWLFSDSGSAQVMAGEMWPKAGLPITRKSRMVAMVKCGANSYAVDVQRVVATTNHVTWNFGTTHMGMGTNDFSCNVALTPVSGTTNDALTYKFRKHAFSGIYWPAANTNTGYGTLEFQWKLSNNSGSRGNIVNLDGNGGTVAVYNASANMGAATNTFLDVQLFDRTNDYVVAADAFSSYYGFLTRRAYVLPRPGGPNVDTTHLALTVPFVGTNFVTASTSLVVSGQADDASATKALQVQASGYTDLHLLGPDTTTRVVQVAGQCFDGAYGFVRSDSTGAVVEVKLVGGGCLSNSACGLVLSSRFVGGTITQPNYTSNTFVASGWTGVRKPGWYRFHNDTHHAENYITGFSGSTVAWRGDALIGTVDVADGYASGNTIITDNGSLPVLDYPKRRTGITAMNEAGTKIFQVNATGSTNLTRIAGDTIAGSDFTDLDNDGWEEARLYDFGPGDAVEVPSEACLVVNPAGGWTLSANASVTVTVPGNDGEALYLDGTEQTTTYTNGTLTATLGESSLTGYGQALTCGASSDSLQSGSRMAAVITESMTTTATTPGGAVTTTPTAPSSELGSEFLAQAALAAEAGQGLILGTVRGGGAILPEAQVYGLALALDAAGNVIRWQQVAQVETDLMGGYLLALPTGGVYAVAAEGKSSTPWLCEGYHQVEDVAAAVRFVPDIAAPVTGIDFDLIEGALIGGTVRNAKTKLPLAGIQIEASQGALSSLVFCGVSESNGTYWIHVPAGSNYTIKAVGAGWGTQSYSGNPLTAVMGSPVTNVNFMMKVAR